MASDDVLVSEAPVGEVVSVLSKPQAKRGRGRPRKLVPTAQQQAKAELVDTSAPTSHPTPKAAVEEIKPGSVGRDQDRANDVVAVNGSRWNWVMRQR